MSTALKQENSQVTLDEALSLAQGHHKAGNYVLAERTYRDILRSVPDHFPTTQFLGILLFQLGNYNDARYYLEKAIESAPDDRNCINNYGGVLTQAGEYEEAINLYNKALQIDDKYLDALNNKAYALWSMDRLSEAEETARKALEVDSENPVALNNLAIVLAKRVKYEESIDVWKKLAAQRPKEGMVWSNWGNTLREMGRLGEAGKKCEKAIETTPDNPEALNNLANVKRDTGHLKEAVELYRKATNIKPDYFHAHTNMAIALVDDMRYEEAVIAARYAIAFNRDFAPAYSALSKAQLEMGDYTQAHMAAQRAMHLNPDSAWPYLDLAEVLVRLNNLHDAEATINEAIKREPDSPRAYMKLSEIREFMGDSDKAHEAINKAIELSPDMPALWLRKGMIDYLQGQVEDGIKYLDKALELSPKWVAVMNHKAEMLISYNQNEEAEKLVREILEITKEIPATYSTLGSLKKFESEDDPDFQDMKKLEPKVKSFGKQIETVFHFTISKAYEQMKNYDLAFEYLQKANDLKKEWMPHFKDNIDAVWALKKKYTPQFIERLKVKGYESDLPVFIVGMPRSGTTLTEQIIAAHPDVWPAGERNDIGQIHKKIIESGNFTAKDLGEEYVNRMKKLDKTGRAKRVTDKMPHNFLYIGFIRSILPNAKIIHCRRNPIDTCLSCYKQNFARGQNWSYDMEELAHEYLRYEDLMEHWRRVFPGLFLEINYEETVNNFEQQARKLIDFIGLEWNDACLEPHKQKRAVITASKAQVTKPVYTTSVEQWKRYEKQLQPLVRIIRPDQALAE